MTVQESVREAAQLRLKMHVNSRLRLETLAALSRVFREHGEPIRDELLGSLVFAVPGELLGEAPPAAGYDEIRAKGKPSTPGGGGDRPVPTRQPGRPSVPGR